MILDITSTDVLHSWWVPALGGQVQATPGDVVQTWFKADEVGTYAGQLDDLLRHRLSRRCGPGSGSSRVPEYTAYVEQLQKDLTAAQEIIADGSAGARPAAVAQAEGAP